MVLRLLSHQGRRLCLLLPLLLAEHLLPVDQRRSLAATDRLTGPGSLAPRSLSYTPFVFSGGTRRGLLAPLRPSDKSLL